CASEDQSTIRVLVYFAVRPPASDYDRHSFPTRRSSDLNRLLVSGADTVLWQVSIGDTTYNHFFTLPSDQRNAWHHYALVYNGTAVAIAYDGTQITLAQRQSASVDYKTTQPTIGWGSVVP